MDLWQDVRYAVRRLIASRWVTLAAVTALGLGIGANATVFTLVNAVLIRGLPFADPESIMAVFTRNERNEENGGLSYPDYVDVRDGTRSFSGLSSVLNSPINLADGDEAPERIQGGYVDANLFTMIGEQPVLGRGFGEGDDVEGAEPVVLLGYSVWQSRYAGDSAVIGRTVRVNSLPATVVGVMAPEMRFPQNTDIWVPRVNLPPESGNANRDMRNRTVIGRLAPGVTEEQAREELRLIGANLAEAYPETNRNLRPDLEPLADRGNDGEIRAVFLSLLGAVVFVLLIACANVASLLLARSVERMQEMAVRVSLGATRVRLVRQLLVESVLMAALAGLIGLGFAVLGVRWFDGVTQDVGKPYYMVFSLDPIVFAYMGGVCVTAVLLFGLAPALHVSRTDVNEVLKEGTRGGSGGVGAKRWTGALVVAEVALTLVLLSGAGFMLRSLMAMYRLDPGVETAGLVRMQTYLPLTKYPDPEPRRLLYADILDRLAADPRVASSVLLNALPLMGGGASGVEVDGRVAENPEQRPQVTTITASDRYFEVMGIGFVSGRGFAPGDGMPGALNAVVNQRFVDLHLGGGDALGRTFRVGYDATPIDQAEWLTIVGVVPTIQQRVREGIANPEPDPVVYLPLNLNPTRGVQLAVRSSVGPAQVAEGAREAIRLVDPDLPLAEIATMDQALAEERWPFLVFGTLFSVFAGIALVLSAVGLYSITARSVVQRVREFGIRISLGAEPKQIYWLALKRVLTHLAIGLPIGLAGAYGVGTVLQSLLIQTGPKDPITLGAIVLIMAAVTVIACLLPARDAARLDPVTALRVE
jgi:predicted permease